MYKCINMSGVSDSSAESYMDGASLPEQRTATRGKNFKKNQKSKEKRKKVKDYYSYLHDHAVQSKQYESEQNIEELREHVRALDIRDSNGQHNDNSQLREIKNRVDNLTKTVEELAERCKKCCADP